MADIDRALGLIDDIRHDLRDAATDVLSLTLTGMELIRRPDLPATDLAEVFTGLLEASCFQDLTGQKLDQLRAALTGHTDTRRDAALLNGPTAGRGGLDQDAADRLFAVLTEPSNG
jgi:hypothetical protein